jgi:hypothetical protein
MASYGQHVAFADSYTSLLLMLNFPADQKVILTDYFVQYGVDLYGCVVGKLDDLAATESGSEGTIWQYVDRFGLE